MAKMVLNLAPGSDVQAILLGMEVATKQMKFDFVSIIYPDVAAFLHLVRMLVEFLSSRTVRFDILQGTVVPRSLASIDRI